MGYAVILHFDKASEAKILELWKEAISYGGDPYLIDCGIRPHITIAIFENADFCSFCDKLMLFTSHTSKFSLRFGSIGVFASGQGVLYLAPVMTDKLLELHKGFYDFFEGDIYGVNELYAPNNWVPHCSISLNNSIEATSSIITRIMEVYEPMEAQICEIAVVELKPAIKYLNSQEVE